MAATTTRRTRAKETTRARGLLASATRIDLTDRRQVEVLRKFRSDWHKDAWGYFDSVPEVQNTGTTVGSLMSRVRLFPAYRPDPSQTPVPLDPIELAKDPDTPPDVLALAQVASVEMKRLESYAGSTSAIMGAFGVNFSIVGEAYLLGIPDALAQGGERWVVASSDELKVEEGTKPKVFLLSAENDAKPELLPDDTFFLRLWRRHPRWAQRAFSPMQSCLGICETLLALERRVQGQTLSGLNAGILAYADSIAPPDRQQVDGDGQATDDPIAADLIKHFSEPISDPGSPSGLVPYILRLPVSDTQKVSELLHYISTDRPFDEQTIRLRDEARSRLASGLDLPPEWQQGLGQANHWGAGEIQRQTFDAYIEPLVLVVVDALTRGLLQPALISSGLDPTQAFVWYDPSALFGEGDKFGRALDMHRVLAVSDAYLRESGRAPEDAKPDEMELARRIASTAGMTPTAAVGVLESVDAIPEQAAEAGIAIDQGGTPNGQSSNGQSSNGQTPQPPESLTAAATFRTLGQRHAALDVLLRTRIQTAADGAVRRLVEMAGSRLRRRLSNRSEYAQWKTLPVIELPSVVGRERLRAFGIEEAALIEDELADLERLYRTLVDRTQRQAVAVAIRELRSDLAEEELLAPIAEERESAIGLGWASLADSVRFTALGLLFAPSGESTPARGEFDPTAHIQAGTIRESLALAGGARSRTANPDVPVGVTQVATGDLVREILRESFSVIPTGWVWETGDPAVPFEPHQNLAGVEFARFDDPALSNDEGWPSGFYYRPGDHQGCVCSVAPIYGEARESRDDQDSREFAGAFEEA